MTNTPLTATVTPVQGPIYGPDDYDAMVPCFIASWHEADQPIPMAYDYLKWSDAHDFIVESIAGCWLDDEKIVGYEEAKAAWADALLHVVAMKDGDTIRITVPDPHGSMLEFWIMRALMCVRITYS